MAQMPAFHREAYYSVGHRHVYDVTAQLQNQTDISAPLGNFVLPSLTLRRYELAGLVFWSLQEASEGTFLREFHEEYFPRCRENPNLHQQIADVRQLMQDMLPVVDGTLASTWAQIGDLVVELVGTSFEAVGHWQAAGRKQAAQ